MSDQKVRREIALRAARLMYARECTEYFTAKRKAAREIQCDRGNYRDLPSNREIREEILLLADLMEGEERLRELTSMRIEALRFLRLLDRYKSKLIGSVLTGHVRVGSDIDIHVFCDSPQSVADMLDREGYACTVERKKVNKHGEIRVYTHIHVEAAFSVELTVYAADKSGYPFKSSITGKTIERAGPSDLEAIIRESEPVIDIEAEMAAMDPVGEAVEDWELFASLLRVLESVKQNPKYHPEGDALFHSLQVFDLAKHVRGYDQEFLLAALLHDVGKGIDPAEHVASGVEALEGCVTPRTLWFIEHHMEAHEARDGTLGHRARRRLAASPDYEDLLLLSELDQAGRVQGAVTSTVEEAIAYLMELDASTRMDEGGMDVPDADDERGGLVGDQLEDQAPHQLEDD
jgi:hypothetical protein